MIEIVDGKWIADLGKMTCKNVVDDITLEFDEVDGQIYSNLTDLTAETIWEGHISPDEDKFYDKIMEEGERVFLKAYRAIKKGEDTDDEEYED